VEVDMAGPLIAMMAGKMLKGGRSKGGGESASPKLELTSPLRLHRDRGFYGHMNPASAKRVKITGTGEK
jgi:hypothetical protein